MGTWTCTGLLVGPSIFFVSALPFWFLPIYQQERFIIHGERRLTSFLFVKLVVTPRVFFFRDTLFCMSWSLMSLLPLMFLLGALQYCKLLAPSTELLLDFFFCFHAAYLLLKYCGVKVCFGCCLKVDFELTWLQIAQCQENIHL